jgi:predicted small secreted protein
MWNPAPSTTNGDAVKSRLARTGATVAALALLVAGCNTDELAEDADETGEAEATGEALDEGDPAPEDTDPELAEELADAEGALRESADDVGQDEEHPPEFLLAVIDVQDSEPDADTVDTYGQALDAADAACDEDRELTADLAALGLEIAGERGSDTTVLDLLRGLEEAVPEDEAPADCANVMADLLAVLTAE